MPTTTSPTSSWPVSRADAGPQVTDRPSGAAVGLERALGPATLVVLAGTVAYGVVLRLWLLVHLAFQSDEAVVGLMGRQILQGHPTVFYWGSFYGGIEAWVVAPALWVFGSTATAVNATPAVLAALAAAVAGFAVVLAGGRWRLAALAATAVWVWPYAAVFNSVRELGLRGVALCCGLILLLCAVAIQTGRRHLAVYGALGLAAGLGWWASPEIAYFMLPAGCLLAVAWDRLPPGSGVRRPWRPLPVLVTMLGAGVGALPWLYANVESGFTSLHAGALGSSGLGYGARLGAFFTHVLPTQLGVQGVPSGKWVGGPVVGPLLLALVVILIVVALGRAVVEVRRRGRAAAPVGAVALAVVCFPLLYAGFPNAGYWVDGRYGVYLPPLVALLLALTAAGWTRSGAPQGAHVGGRRSGRRLSSATAVSLAGCLVVAGALALTVGAAHTERVPASPGGFFSSWSANDPNHLSERAAARLEAAGIRHAYANYWMAYVLDFLGDGRLVITPSLPDEPRNTALYDAVAHARRPAYLFAAPGDEGASSLAFANDEPGPAGYTEAAFTALLRREGVDYRIVHAGLLDAVVPARPIAFPPG